MILWDLNRGLLSSEIQAIAEESIDNMAKSTSDKIIELNGGKPVNAVFVVGGGGKCQVTPRYLLRILA